MNALGMVEVFGFTTAICCADVAAKAADVKIIALDKNKPLAGDDAPVPLIMNVKMEGSVAAVEEAVNAAKTFAVSRNCFVTSHVIPRPGIGTEKLAVISEVGKDRWVDAVKKEDTKEEKAVSEPKQAEIKKDEKQIGISEIESTEKTAEKQVKATVKEEAPAAPKNTRGRPKTKK